MSNVDERALEEIWAIIKDEDGKLKTAHDLLDEWHKKLDAIEEIIDRVMPEQNRQEKEHHDKLRATGCVEFIFKESKRSVQGSPSSR